MIKPTILKMDGGFLTYTLKLFVGVSGAGVFAAAFSGDVVAYIIISRKGDVRSLL